MSTMPPSMPSGPPPAAGSPTTTSSDLSSLAGPGASPGGAGQPGSANDVATQVTSMVMNLDQALMAVQETFADTGGQEVQQARQLLQVATSKFLGKMGVSPAVSPTETGGMGFPEGGLQGGI